LFTVCLSSWDFLLNVDFPRRDCQVARLAEESKANKTVADANVADPHTIGSILRLFHFIPQVAHCVHNVARCISALALPASYPVASLSTEPRISSNLCRLFGILPPLTTQIVQSVLSDDQAFKQASGDAFTTIVNTDMGKFSVMQMLAAYCDNILKVMQYKHWLFYNAD
jgi:hypothetical protein